MSFFGEILEMCETKKNSQFSKNNKVIRKGEQAGTNKQIVYNLVYFSHKILSLLKTKVFCNYVGNRLQPILEWINKTLTYLCDNELLSMNSSNSQSLFVTILEIINSIYSVNNYRSDNTKLSFNPIEPILYFCNQSIL